MLSKPYASNFAIIKMVFSGGRERVRNVDIFKCFQFSKYYVATPG